MPLSLGLGLGLTHGSNAFTPASLFAGGVPGYAYNFVQNAYTDTARTIRAGSGDAMASADDLSGNGNHIVQATASKRAVLGTAAGFLALQPDGVDDSYQTPGTINLSAATKITLFFCIEQIQNSPLSVFFETTANFNGTINAILCSLNEPAELGGVAFAAKAPTLYDNTLNITPSTVVPRIMSVSVALNNLAATSALRIIPRYNGAPFAPSFAQSNIGSGGYLNVIHYFFGRNSTSFFSSCRCVGIAVVGKECSPAEIAAMERYYGRLCGLSF